MREGDQRKLCGERQAKGKKVSEKKTEKEEMKKNE